MSPFHPIGVRSHEQPAGPQIRRNGALDTPLVKRLDGMSSRFAHEFALINAT